VNPLIVIGAGLGAAIALLAAALAPARLTLAQSLDAVRRPPQQPLPRGVRARHTLAAPLRQLGLPRPRTRRDLAVLERDPTAFLAGQLGLASLGLLAPAATVAALNLMGAGIGWTMPLWLGLILAVGGYVLAQMSVHEDAEQRRRLIRHTLAALLDIVPPALASGAGVEQALTDASRIASGWAARRIRHALGTARLTRQPIWQALRELGQSTGVIELEQLAGTLQLASGEGTRIREALTARGEALSQRLAAEMEAEAEAATERMSIPLMALTSVFMLFLVYPAMAALQP
jgi:tight adherence protein C